MSNRSSPPFWLAITLIGSVTNILVMLLPQPLGITSSLVIGWIVYTMLYSGRLEQRKIYLLVSGLIMTLTTYIGLTIACFAIAIGSVCERNLLIVSMGPSLIPFLVWLLLTSFDFYRLIKKSSNKQR